MGARKWVSGDFIAAAGMVSALVIIAATPMFVVAGAFPMEDWMRIALIAVGIVVIVIGIAIACILDRDAGIRCDKSGCDKVSRRGDVSRDHDLLTV